MNGYSIEQAKRGEKERAREIERRVVCMEFSRFFFPCQNPIKNAAIRTRRENEPKNIAQSS